MVDDEHHDPLFAAARFNVTGEGLHAFQGAGFEMGVTRDLAPFKTFFYRAVPTQYRQRGFQFGGEWAARGMLQQEEAAALLGVCERSFRRYLDRYEDARLEGLIDKPVLSLVEGRLSQVSQRRAARWIRSQDPILTSAEAVGHRDDPGLFPGGPCFPGTGLNDIYVNSLSARWAMITVCALKTGYCKSRQTATAVTTSRRRCASTATRTVAWGFFMGRESGPITMPAAVK